MIIHYRISSWRFDVRTHCHSTPQFQGESVEECDKKAIAYFDAESAKPENAWDGMRIVRIDTPAVEEKTTMLKSNGRQEKIDDYSL